MQEREDRARVEGRLKEKFAPIKRLLAAKVPIKDIMKFADCSEEEILLAEKN